jgi:NAD(P)-dependent dehydrogenase (short-subunit alcohol dehydrogenase family)
MNIERGMTAVVTGAASGIGRGMALTFAKRGMNIVVADIDAEGADVVAEEVRALGVRSLAMRTDVADARSVQDLADRAYGEAGPVHLLCNNAGVLVFRPMSKARIEDWQWVLSVNLWGVINGLQAFLPRMLEQGGERHIVNTASISGLITHPGLPVGLYNTSKFAVVGLSEALRGEVGTEGIGVSVLCPGDVRTRITESGRNRPEAFGGAFQAPPGVANAMEQAMDPLRVGELVARAVLRNRLYVHTHRENRRLVEERTQVLLAAFDDIEGGS